MTPYLEISQDALAAFCRRHHIRKLSLFGSALTDRFGPESDIDVLVEFEPDAVIGFRFGRIANELEAMLNRSVDLLTPAGLSPYFKDEVLQQAEVLYEQP